jgi:flagellar biosynthetic protein FliR
LPGAKLTLVWDLQNPAMGLFDFHELTFFSFLLTLMRISLVVFLLPFFGGSGMPRMVKAAFCLVLTLGLWPSLSFSGVSLPSNQWQIGLMLAGELFLGLVMGMVVRFVFAGIQTAGHIIGFQMGFAMMNVVDPMSGVSVSLTSQFLYIVTLLIFLALNGHLVMLQGLGASFEFVPPGSLLLNDAVVDHILEFSGQIFVLAIKVAAPVMVAELMVSLSLGLMARMAPQVNVLFVGFPIKIAVGFLFMGVLLTLLSQYMQEFVGDLDGIFQSLLRTAA